MKIIEGKKELLLVLLLLLISGLSHGVNMFGFPYYENDEGAYMSQAWSFLKLGELAPYTYWYDHAPFGWIMIAVWTTLTGGFFTFGPSVNSGRVLMLVLHVLTTLFLYVISKRLSGKKVVAVLSVLIYSFSPLGVYYQRRVLLDNIMTFWVFAAMALVVSKKLKISRIIISALFLGLAVLSKENAIFFIPLFLYAIYVNSDPQNRKFGLSMFFVTTVCVVSSYFLYALLKKEFFPVGFLGDQTDHVSMVTSFTWQVTRTTGLPFWTHGSDFYGNLLEWVNKDKNIVYMGAFSLVVALLLSIKHQNFRIPVFFGILFTIFLIRGGIVIGFYIVPLIPVFALLISQVLEFLVSKIASKNRELYMGIMSLSIIGIPIILMTSHNGQYFRNETDPQVKAIEWVKDNVEENAYIVIDNYMYTDLKEPGYVNDKVFPNADWFWKISYDSQIIEDKYGNDFRKIEYIILSHEMLKQIGVGTQENLRKAMVDFEVVETWTQETTSFIDFANYVTTNGDWMSVLKRNSFEDIYLSRSWVDFKENFIHSYGQVIDPANGGITTSEGQSYAMLRSVWMGDKNTFKGVWKWTQDHMQHRTDDMLISWLWSEAEKKIVDGNSASDADLDIALALLFASKKFNDQKYLMDAFAILRDIWEKEVVEIEGRYLLTSSPSSEMGGEYLVNPSYFSPATYRIFAEVDKTRDWDKLANDSYYFLNQISDNSITGLSPNWVVISDQGEILSAAKYINSNPDNYGYDSFRIFWRVALDYVWNSNETALNYLNKSAGFFSSQWESKNKFNSIYALNGRPLTNNSDLATTVGPLSLFIVNDKDLAREIFDKEFSDIVYSNEVKDDLNYYNQNWVWFGNALYLNRLDNLWGT